MHVAETGFTACFKKLKSDLLSSIVEAILMKLASVESSGGDIGDDVAAVSGI